MNLLSRTGKHGRTALLAPAWLAALFVLLPLLPVRAAQAQGQSGGEATVSAALADPSVDAGESTQYYIVVENGNSDRPPVPPVTDGLTITYLGPNKQTSYSLTNRGFVGSTKIIYVYTVQTFKPGRFTIPGQEVPVGDATLRTLPVTLTVEDPGGPAATRPDKRFPPNSSSRKRPPTSAKASRRNCAHTSG